MLRTTLMTLSLTALVAGCGAIDGDYCALATPIYMQDEATVDWLISNDRLMLVDVLIHNETNARVCK